MIDMEQEYPSRPGKGFLYTMGAIMVVLGVLLAAELSPIFGHPLQLPLGGTGPVATGTIVMPAGVGSNTQLSFVPSITTLIIGTNDTVTFKNDDTVAHTVTAVDRSFDSLDIAAGKSWTHQFSTPGNYSYFCIYHKWMTGSLIVKQATTGAFSVNIPAGTGNNPNQNYAPSSITLVVGVNNTITFVNQDSTKHTVTATGGSFDSGDIQAGGTWSHMFAAGTYAFHCTYHNWMSGTITVKAP
jgi:plastocyanin